MVCEADPEFCGSPLKSIPQSQGLKGSPVLSVGGWLLNASLWTEASSWEDQRMFPSIGLWWGQHFKMSLISMSLSPSMPGGKLSLNFPHLNLKCPHSHKCLHRQTVGWNWWGWKGDGIPLKKMSLIKSLKGKELLRSPIISFSLKK